MNILGATVRVRPIRRAVVSPRLRWRSVRWWLALCVILPILAACTPAGNDIPSTPPAPFAPTDDAQESASTESASIESASIESASIESASIEIEYWQSDYGANVTAMDILIEQFHDAYPQIRVIHNYTTALEDFPSVMAARIPAGIGPDVVSLYYSWQNAWIDAGYLAPLPATHFPPAAVRAQYSPIAQAGWRADTLYTLPTAVRTAALFYNRDLMAAAGLDPAAPPTTLAELEDQAAQCTQRNEDGTYEIMGLPISMNGQADPWFREVLLRQFGQEPYGEPGGVSDSESSDDLNREAGRTILWNASPAGYAAWEQLLTFQTDLETGDPTDFESDPNYFVAGRACFHIDTLVRLETIATTAADLNFGVIELPVHNDTQSTFGTYWAHGITQKSASSPERLDAAATFVRFITSPAAGRLWLDIAGEIPAHLQALAVDPLRNDPVLGPFFRGATYAHAPLYVDEDAERAALRAAYNAVVFNGLDPAAALDQAVATIQAIHAP